MTVPMGTQESSEFDSSSRGLASSKLKPVLESQRRCRLTRV